MSLLRFNRFGARASQLLRRNVARRCFTSSGVSASAATGNLTPHKSKSYPDKEALFGQDPDEQYQSEGFETITVVTYSVCLLILVVGLSNRKMEPFKDWARTEAIARAAIIEAGGEIEFGKFYSTASYEDDELGTPPKLVGEGDD